MRTLFAKGSVGNLVKGIQGALTKAGFDTRGVDGWYAFSAGQKRRLTPLLLAFVAGTLPLVTRGGTSRSATELSSNNS